MKYTIAKSRIAGNIKEENSWVLETEDSQDIEKFIALQEEYTFLETEEEQWK